MGTPRTASLGSNRKPQPCCMEDLEDAASSALPANLGTWPRQKARELPVTTVLHCKYKHTELQRQPWLQMRSPSQNKWNTFLVPGLQPQTQPTLPFPGGSGCQQTPAEAAAVVDPDLHPGQAGRPSFCHPAPSISPALAAPGWSAAS